MLLRLICRQWNRVRRGSAFGEAGRPSTRCRGLLRVSRRLRGACLDIGPEFVTGTSEGW